MSGYNIIPRWLCGPYTGSQSASQVGYGTVVQGQQYVSALSNALSNTALSNTAAMLAGGSPGQLPLPMPPMLPPGVNTRNRFADLIHNIEDIQGYKGPYDDDIHAMLDMRPMRLNNCKVKLTAFLCFMNCNGVDRHNIMPFVRYAESIGIIFM